MVHRVLVLVALALSALIAASFVLFARDQLAGASVHQQRELVSAAPIVSPPENWPPPHEGQPRRFIDNVTRTLTAPFAGIPRTNSEWTKRAVPTLLGLLVYGVGIGYLARYSRGMAG